MTTTSFKSLNLQTVEILELGTTGRECVEERTGGLREMRGSKGGRGPTTKGRKGVTERVHQESHRRGGERGVVSRVGGGS